MALPWIIGGLVVGGIAVAAKLSNSSDGGDYDYDNNDYEEEERRRAARERKKRALDQKIESLMADVSVEGARRASVLQADLSPMIEVEYSSYRPYAGEMDEDGDIDQTYSSMMQYDLEPEFVPEAVQENLERFIDLYNVQSLEATPYFANMQARLTSIREELQVLSEKRSALLALYESLNGDEASMAQGYTHSSWQFEDAAQSSWEQRWNESFTAETDDLQEQLEALRKMINSLKD